MAEYIIRLVIIILLLAPVYLLVRRPWRRKSGREWGVMLFLLFNAALLTLALEGDYGTPREMLASAVSRISSGEGINLVPFRTISGFFAGAKGDRFLVNILGNVVMFMPWGFGLAALWERFRTPLRIAALSLAITVFIEASQLFIGRSVDVDDLMLNFAGSMLGALVWWIIHRLLSRTDAH